MSGSLKNTGLFADPALYAGLSQKILNGSSPWNLSGEFFFKPLYADHPPYFFIWGSWLMGLIGTHEISARLMGILPALLGILLLVRGLFYRSKDLGLAVGTGFLLLTWGHFTRYTFSPYLEAPLVLGSVLLLFGALDKNYIKISLGLLVFAFSKGVLVLIPAGALSLYFLRDRPRFFIIGFTALGALALSLGLWQIFAGTESLAVQTYIQKQVLRSFFEGRSLEEGFAPAKGSFFQGLLFYGSNIARYSLPWFLLWVFGLRTAFKDTNLLIKNLAKLSLWMTLCFLVAFSVSAIHLPHYLHPVYMFWAPVGFLGLRRFCQKLPTTIAQKLGAFFSKPLSYSLSFVLLGILFVAVQLVGDPQSSGPNRGGDFMRLVQTVNRLGPLSTACQGLEIEGNQNDQYRAESYALWYLRGSKLGRDLPIQFVTEGTQSDQAKMRLTLKGEKFDPSVCF